MNVEYTQEVFKLINVTKNMSRQNNPYYTVFVEHANTDNGDISKLIAFTDFKLQVGLISFINKVDVDNVLLLKQCVEGNSSLLQVGGIYKLLLETKEDKSPIIIKSTKM